MYARTIENSVRIIIFIKNDNKLTIGIEIANIICKELIRWN